MTTNIESTNSIFHELPRGIRNNNPGNLMWEENLIYPGSMGKDKDGYRLFSHPFYGVLSLGLDLRAKYEHDNLRTIRSIITKYAPPATNDTRDYIRDACNLVGANADDILIWPRHLHNLAFAICHHENGITAVATVTFNKGIDAALVWKL